VDFKGFTSGASNAAGNLAPGVLSGLAGAALGGFGGSILAGMIASHLRGFGSTQGGQGNAGAANLNTAAQMLKDAAQALRDAVSHMTPAGPQGPQGPGMGTFGKSAINPATGLPFLNMGVGVQPPPPVATAAPMAMGPIGLAVAGAMLLKAGFDKARDSLYRMNDKVVSAAEGFAQIMGVPPSIAKFGGAVANLISPLNAVAGMFSALTTGSFDGVKKTFSSLKDVAFSLVKVFFDLRDPAAMVSQALAPFMSQVSKWNPAVVERFQFSLENLSASVGKIFEPLINAGRDFADELNMMITAVGPELRDAVMDLIPPMRQFARDIMPGVISGAHSFLIGLGPVAEKFREVGPMLGRFAEGFGYFIGVAIGAGVVVFDKLVDATRQVIAAFMGAVAVFQEVRDNPAILGSPESARLLGEAAGLEFRRVLGNLRRQPEFAQPGRGPMTFAAQPARQIGIEQLGQEARAKAFGAGVADAAERTATNTEVTARNVAELAQWMRENLPRLAAWLNGPPDPAMGQ
jgi:hypothetical protein